MHVCKLVGALLLAPQNSEKMLLTKLESFLCVSLVFDWPTQKQIASGATGSVQDSDPILFFFGAFSLRFWGSSPVVVFGLFLLGLKARAFLVLCKPVVPPKLPKKESTNILKTYKD